MCEDNAAVPRERWVLDLIVHMPKQSPPSRKAILGASCSATLSLVHDPTATTLERDAVRRWRSSGIRKLVRRARGSDWARVLSEASVVAHCGSALVAAYVPRRIEDVDPALASLQLSNFADGSPNDGAIDLDCPVRVALAPLGMTTGKAAAQAAHAAQLLAERLSSRSLNHWREAGWTVLVDEPDAAEFSVLSADAIVVVNDAGFTEVQPGSVTACATLTEKSDWSVSDNQLSPK